MQFQVGDLVVDGFSGYHGIILELLPYEYCENDLDSDMEDEYKVFWFDDGQISYIREIYIKKEC